MRSCACLLSLVPAISFSRSRPSFASLGLEEEKVWIVLKDGSLTTRRRYKSLKLMYERVEKLKETLGRKK